MSDLSSYPMVHQALVALGKDFYMINGGDPQTEEEWVACYHEIINEFGEASNKQSEWTVTWQQIQDKIAELNAQ